MEDVNPPPVIADRSLNGDAIDLDQLGDRPLLTYIKYPGIALNDVLWPNWRGCGAQGEVEDFSNSRLDVTTAGGYTPELGMPAYIPNARLKGLNQGWAFYSYALGASGDPNTRGPESLRVFCYVGIRPGKSSHLPVVQIKESHQLALDPAAVGAAGASAIVPPYRAMSIGDKVTFTWQGYFMGTPEPAYSDALTLKTEHIGLPLKFTVPQIEVIGIPGEHAEVSYRIEYAGTGQSSESGVQTIQIVKPGAALLPELVIKDYAGGPVDPGRYPDGLTLQIKPVYAGIQEGDWVLVYWAGSGTDKSVVKALRVDRSTLDSGVIDFHIEPRWLSVSGGGRVTVSYQYARTGGAESGEPRQLDISMPLHLPAPIVDNATPAGENRGDLQASTSGAYVSIPADAETGAGKIEVHWEGNPKGGRGVILDPVGGSGRRYHVPSTLIAANMSIAEGARFPVYYTVTPPGDKSILFNLLVKPVPRSQYPDTQCTQAMGTSTLSLQRVPSTGADLTINPWPFVAVGQLLTIEAAGISNSGAVSITVRDKVPVTDTEFTQQQIKEKLPRAYLQSLKLNEQFTLRGWVSFDAGDTYVPFNDTNLTLTS
ncbi:hypothetical protein [Pseudomonas sp. IT-P4]|uniref:hypothetical protein n=1 Tax=Pseudomonas sp. IT-P4 TaxID=3026446 RepID=UPI0039E0948F